jgi:uncharacterized protein
MDTRRDALRKLALATAGLALPWPRLLGSTSEPKPASTRDQFGPVLPTQPFGRTGLRVTKLTLGGYQVGSMAEKEAAAVVATAIELGVRTFDTAESYQNGRSEERYGMFLTPKYRAAVQIFTKTMARDAATARTDLEDSLRRLKTDYLDLWQMHAIESPADVDARLAAGVLDVMLKAKAEGKVRHLGFTGHTTYRAHLHMLKVTDVMESCLLPINVADPSYESFILNVLPVLNERGLGVQAMKALAHGGFMGRSHKARGLPEKPAIIPKLLTIPEALEFVWSLPVHTLVLGVDNVAQLRENVTTALTGRTLDAAQRQELIDRAADLGRSGIMEWYKK